MTSRLHAFQSDASLIVNPLLAKLQVSFQRAHNEHLPNDLLCHFPSTFMVVFLLTICKLLNLKFSQLLSLRIPEQASIILTE
jgi:hypothetical protein